MSLKYILENFKNQDYDKLFQEFMTIKKTEIEAYFSNFPLALELENDKIIAYRPVPKTGIEKIKYVFEEFIDIRDDVQINIVKVLIQYVKPIPTGNSIEDLYNVKFENDLLIEFIPSNKIKNETELLMNKETIKFILV
jgi:hypothetical protein